MKFKYKKIRNAFAFRIHAWFLTGKVFERALWAKQRKNFGAAVKIFKAPAEENFGSPQAGEFWVRIRNPEYKKIRNAFAFRIHVGCPTRIRTPTNRVRVCRATVTQSGNI